MSVKENLERIRNEIGEAALRSNRSPDSVTLAGVSKTVDEKRILEAFEAGLNCFGESRVREAEEKIFHLKEYGLEWHLVGRLQSNKVRKAAGLFNLIQSVDSISTAEKIDRCAREQGRAQDILIEVNASAEEAKSGVRPDGLKVFLENCLRFSNIRVKGLMTVGPLTEDEGRTRDCFLLLKDLYDRSRAENPGLDLPFLSMGMSDDFPLAIECGSTMVRIGRRIFGDRETV